MKSKYKQLTIALAMAGIGHAATISLDRAKADEPWFQKAERISS